MGQTLKIAPGFDRTWTSQLFSANGEPTVYTDAAVFDSAVWRGQSELTLFSPAAAWIDPTVSKFSVTISATQPAGLEPGLYRMQVGVTFAGFRALAFDGNLEIIEVPGSTTQREPYVTYPDLLNFFDQLGTLQTIAGDDASFLQQRAKASDQFDRDLQDRYKPRPGYVKTRRPVMDPILGFDVPDPTATPINSEGLKDALAAGAVIVDENARELICKLTITQILDQQEVMGQMNPYAVKAAKFEEDVMNLWDKHDIQLDVDLDGRADMLIGRDIILLPPGTAP